MNMKPLSKRHRQFLVRFRRNRDRWEAHSPVFDIHRLRQIEWASIGLSIYFLTTAHHWMEALVFPKLSWMTAYGIFVLLFILYMLHDLYWAHRSVTYMIDNRAWNLSELEAFKTEPVNPPERERTSDAMEQTSQNQPQS